MDFLEWLGDSRHVVIVSKQCVANTLSCTIITVTDESLEHKIFVSADRGLVSYDTGRYQQYSKGDEVDKVIEDLIKSYNNW